MRTFFKISLIFLSLLISSTQTWGQNVSVKEIKELTNDFSASKHERKDANGKSCALVKIAIPSLQNVTFDCNVGDVYNNAGEYSVYVAPGTKFMTISSNGKRLCTVSFINARLEIQSKHTYQVVLDIEQTRDMVFHVEPADASVMVGNTKVPLNAEGIGKFTCKPDQLYEYTISAPNYESYNDAFMITSEDDAEEPINISLERKMGYVTFDCNAKEFEVLVDNESQGTIKKGESLSLPVGYCELRIVSDKYEDWTDRYYVSSVPSKLTVKMKKSNDVSNDMRTLTNIYIGGGMSFDFNPKIEMEKNNLRGYPIRAGIDFEFFTRPWFIIRPGFEITAYTGKDMKVNDKMPFELGVPVMFCLNAPMGRFNRHHFSIGAGIVGGYTFLDLNGDKKNDETESEKNPDQGEGNLIPDVGGDKSDYFAGLRVDARFSFNRIMVGLTLDYKYYLLRSFANNGLLSPTLTIGYKF